MRSLTLLLVLGVLASSLVGASAAPFPSTPQLRLHRSILDASAANLSVPRQALTAAASDSQAIIQFRGPITPTNRAALEATGITVLEYIPDFAYLVRGTPEQIDNAAQAPGVFARYPFTLADKLSPALLRMLASGARDVGRVRVIGWPDSVDALALDLGALKIDSQASLTADQLLQVASLPSVRWIEPMGQPRLLNDVARSIMRVNQAWQQRALFGAGQIVAVTDSGLDTGITATISADFAGRIVATHVLLPTGDLADSNGHGTHVAGSVAGAGVQSGANPAQHQYIGSFAGVAPEAGLVIQAFEADALGAISGLPDDYYPLFSQTYADGARVHTNSWGDYTGPVTDTESAYGGYPYGSQRVDQFVWDHPDMTIFFAAGNSGIDGVPLIPGLLCAGGNGVIDPDSMLAPGTAKNIVTVGASESQRSSGGYGGFPWVLVNFCYSANPLALDTMANNPNGMAAFSSRGPTDDGRAKPDLVAPGTNIVSDFSHAPGVNLAFWILHETNPNYAYNNGTSMATPLAAGAGVLVREWLVGQGIADPSAAAIKATLLDTTANIAPGQYGTGPTQEIPLTWPNSVAGWGRVDLGFITAESPYTLWIDDHATGLSTGSVVTYTDSQTRSLRVVDSAQPLRAMLVWSDPPASLSASAQLVNDLDLVVVGPDGTLYPGNNAATGDRTNNVEGVIIANPPAGQYAVRVSAYNVPIAAQPYALAVGGPIGGQNEIGPIRLFLPIVLR
ncbi:MAG TPA: S8 family serine peptidase, partial [Anaerolineae bacterium]